MKQLTLKSLWNAMFLLAVAFSFSACMDNIAVEKEELKQDNQTAMIYDQVIQAPNEEVRDLTFTSLSSEERADFWVFHIDKLISNHQYTSAQLDFLNETKRFVIDIHKEFGQNKEAFDAYQVEEYFEAVPAEIFNSSELHGMFLLAPSENTYSKISTQEGEPSSLALPRCECASAWDCSGHPCIEGDCVKKAFNCGRLRLATCDGICDGDDEPDVEEPNDPEEPEEPNEPNDPEEPGSGPGSGTQGGI